MKYLILGAGPAGLSFANRLRENDEDSFLILEKEGTAGGLCRSVIVDDSPFDIGGGHFLDVLRPHVNGFLFKFMPENEWNKYDRDSKIEIKGNIINHPIESNIWQMQLEDQVEYLKSIAIAGCNLGMTKPTEFVDWVYWKLGRKIAEDYMLPYNNKIFSKDLNELGTYWLDKLPNVSFEETLMSCLTKKAFGSQPGHAQFYYPKRFGYGELWTRMSDEVKSHIEFNKTVISIDFINKAVTTSDGGKYSADIIVTTIPWIEFTDITGMPEEIIDNIAKLKSCSIETRYYSDNLETSAHWIYYPDPGLAYHRILVRHNFCNNSKGYWTETREERIPLTPESGRNNFNYLNKYAYPLNTIDKPYIMKQLLSWAEEQKVYGLGRWGEHQHYNSDATVELALKLHDRLESV